MSLNLAFAMLGDALLLLILLRGIRGRMITIYGPFYIYTAFVLAVDILRWLVLFQFGLRSPQYAAVYYPPTYIMAVLQVWILWDVFRRVIGHSRNPWRDVPRLSIMTTAMTLPVIWGMLRVREATMFYHFQTVALFLQMTLCLVICQEAVQRRGELELGQNLRGMLTGMAVLVGCQSLNFAGYLFNVAGWTVFSFGVQFTYFVALIIFVHALWDYQPLRSAEVAYRR